MLCGSPPVLCCIVFQSILLANYKSAIPAALRGAVSHLSSRSRRCSAAPAGSIPCPVLSHLQLKSLGKACCWDETHCLLLTCCCRYILLGPGGAIVVRGSWCAALQPEHELRVLLIPPGPCSSGRVSV